MFATVSQYWRWIPLISALLAFRFRIHFYARCIYVPFDVCNLDSLRSLFLERECLSNFVKSA